MFFLHRTRVHCRGDPWPSGRVVASRICYSPYASLSGWLLPRRRATVNETCVALAVLGYSTTAVLMPRHRVVGLLLHADAALLR